MILATIPVGHLETNCYILAEDSNSPAIIIDPGSDAPKIKAFLEKNKLTPALIINTHGHFDHIACDNEFDVPIYVHQLDIPLLTDPARNLSSLFLISYSVKGRVRPVDDKEKIELGNIVLEVIHTPGHTPGGISLRCGDMLFSGDTLFLEGVGRTDLPGGSTEALVKSIREKLFVLSDDVRVFPGHGPETTIGFEKRYNPFLK